MADRLLKKKEVLEKLSISNSTLWRWIGEGAFPKGMLLDGRSRRWRLSEVEAWIDEQEARSQGAELRAIEGR